MTVADGALAALDLPAAPALIRPVQRSMRRPRAPAIALLVLGVVLVLGPILGGMFAKAAAGKQMIDNFAPDMEPYSLAGYGNDLAILRRTAAAVDTVYSEQGIPEGKFPLLDVYRQESTAIDDRAGQLLARVDATEPDYQRAAAVGGFDRIPFLLVGSGAVAIYGAFILLAGRTSRARAAVVLVVVASAALVMYPFVSNLRSGTAAGQRMLRSMAPIMTHHEVRVLQNDFVVLTGADGQLNTSFRSVLEPGPAADEIITFVGPETASGSANSGQWPKVSSDLASLVGTINDNIGNFNALEDLNGLARDVGAPGLEAFPWMLVGVGILTAGLAVAAIPRRRTTNKSPEPVGQPVDGA